MKEKLVEKKTDAGEVPKIPIEDVKIKEEMYPRTQTCVDKIKEYAQNVELLPSIITNRNSILIDGFHRLSAHKECGLKEIEYVIDLNSFSFPPTF